MVFLVKPEEIFDIYRAPIRTSQVTKALGKFRVPPRCPDHLSGRPKTELHRNTTLEPELDLNIRQKLVRSAS